MDVSVTDVRISVGVRGKERRNGRRNSSEWAVKV